MYVYIHRVFSFLALKDCLWCVARCDSYDEKVEDIVRNRSPFFLTVSDSMQSLGNCKNASKAVIWKRPVARPADKVGMMQFEFRLWPLRPSDVVNFFTSCKFRRIEPHAAEREKLLMVSSFGAKKNFPLSRIFFKNFGHFACMWWKYFMNSYLE
jgi:hypothetical protein